MRQHAIEVDHQGQTIRGMVYRPAKEARHPAVLMLHGFTGQRIENGFMFVRLARALAGAGFAAVTFDFLNSGESDGAFEEMLVSQELADALRMTQWLSHQPFVDRSRLSLLGFSLGGLVASCVTARTEVYRSLVLLAPTTEQNLGRHAQREGRCELPPSTSGAGLTAESIQFGPHCLHPSFFDDLKKLNSVADCVKNPRPTLLVQGTEDQAVAPTVSAQFVEAMRQAHVPVDVHLIEGADHAFTHPKWRANLFQRIVNWLPTQVK